MKFLTVSYLASAMAGLLSFATFLIMKLTSIAAGADLEWLTWFWVFSPLWIAWAAGNALVCAYVIGSVAKGRMAERR